MGTAVSCELEDPGPARSDKESSSTSRRPQSPRRSARSEPIALCVSISTRNPPVRSSGAFGSAGAVGGRLSARAVDLAVRRIGQRVEGEHLFGAHGLRAGLVTTLAAQGRTEIQIIDQTRHKSSAMIPRYARELDAKRASPLHGMW